MVRGIGKFREHFREYTDQFVLIGGAACDLIMSDAGLSFRATKDLDIVLSIEVLSKDFIGAFWEFVKAGRYQTRQRETGRRQYYRFVKPEENGYPYMLELFSRVPDILEIPDNAILAPIPAGEALSSLSVILMDSPYYDFLHAGATKIDGVPLAGPEHLIPLKAKAWLDLKQKREGGEPVDRRNITKHRNDVFRLYQVTDPEKEIEVPPEIREEMASFLDAMEAEEVELRNLGIKGITKTEIIKELRSRYTI